MVETFGGCALCPSRPLWEKKRRISEKEARVVKKANKHPWLLAVGDAFIQ